MRTRAIQLTIMFAGVFALAICLVNMEVSQASAPTQGQARSAPSGCDPNWNVVDSPNVTAPTSSQLNGVSAVSANDVWAVGLYLSGSTYQTLIMRWNGTAWSIVPSPNGGTESTNILSAVHAISANDVWAVGHYFISGSYRTLTMHWNGTDWTIVASPNFGTSNNFLLSVSAAGANDVWAVGYAGGFFEDTVTMRWNGTAWALVPSPSPGDQSSYLHGVTAISSNDVWAVGMYHDKVDTTERTLIEHWDGTAWSVVSSPNLGTASNFLLSVEAVSANDVWAVGHYINGAVMSTLTQRWDGSAWSVVPSPNVGTGSSYLQDVAVVSGSEVWAVGNYYDGLTPRTLTERWNGTDWSVVPSPNGSGESNFLFAVDAVASGDVWAAGQYQNSTVGQSLTEHWNGSAWSVVPSPNGVGTNNYFEDIAAISSSDIWAVGTHGTLFRTLIEHWDGTDWSIVPSPNVGSLRNWLYGVAAVASNDVWAVGYYDEVPSQTLIEHWDGSAWSIVPSPNVGTDNNYLNSAYAVASNDVWAAGYYYHETFLFEQTMIQHWNGTSWSIIPSPNGGFLDTNYLNDISGTGSNDIWAVGSFLYDGAVYQTLTLHWDGTTWSVVPSPNLAFIDHYLYGVTAIAPNDAWAVGYWGFGNNTQTLVMHWDGTSWTIVTNPNPGSTSNSFWGVHGIASNDVYAVGRQNSASVDRTLIEHWDGSAWSVVSSPNVGVGRNNLEAVTALSSSDVWAVGDYAEGTVAHTLVERYNPCVPSPTPGTPTATATSTPTSNPATSTPVSTSTVVAATSTPVTTATPTQCPIQFTDVPEGSTFYEFIRCMACRGIINGYPSGCETGDPCFRPNNNVTRGQLSKIVSNAAGFDDDPGAQQFEDVVEGSTFYDFIGRLANRDIVSGYPCGGPGEPCMPPGNLPYFRPNANVTRGQISKIVSEAAGYSDTPGPQQFEDVVPGSTFYDWIWRLADRQIMSGYPCGGPGEPCVLPDNRPYFRPQNNATRGQASKIVANTFFPECYTP
ncbi:MAG: S-layer homology domain-containing protein [Chloroflexia bacterium]